jgi:predicted nucleotidyltransferase
MFDMVMLCGSTVKGTVVPGWSDLDIIAITASAWPTGDAIAALRAAVRAAEARAPVGVGIDVGGRPLLVREGRIGGRPLAMTYEVSRYGEVLWGTNILLDVPTLPNVRPTIVRDAWTLTLAELHNWQRLACISTRGATDPTLLPSSLKTVLKLLKHAIEPETDAPFTYPSYLNSFDTMYTGRGRLRTMFAEAIGFRERYASLVASPTESEDAARYLSSELLSIETLAELEEVHRGRVDGILDFRPR